MYALINNRETKPAHPVTVVVADEVHERTMYTQMVIGLARTQMEVESDDDPHSDVGDCGCGGAPSSNSGSASH